MQKNWKHICGLLFLTFTSGDFVRGADNSKILKKSKAIWFLQSEFFSIIYGIIELVIQFEK